MRERRHATILAALALGLAVTACDWPSSGAGGMAEHQAAPAPMFQEATATLDRLTVAGADQHAAADMVEARLLLVRARREHEGGLPREASSDLARLTSMLERIEQRLGAQHAPTPLL